MKTREEIEQAADEYIGRALKGKWEGQSWNWHLRDFAIQQINEALEEAADICRGSVIGREYGEAISALKIK